MFELQIVFSVSPRQFDGVSILSKPICLDSDLCSTSLIIPSPFLPKTLLTSKANHMLFLFLKDLKASSVKSEFLIISHQLQHKKSLFSEPALLFHTSLLCTISLSFLLNYDPLPFLACISRFFLFDLLAQSFFSNSELWL